VFSPQQVRRFVVDQPQIDPLTGVVVGRYAFDDGTRFEERFVVPVPDGGVASANRAAFARVSELLCIVAGVSYYKAAAPPEVELRVPVPSSVVDYLRLAWSHGLGEFAYVNQLQLGDGPRVIATDVDRAEPPGAPVLRRHHLVAVGGGKDSCVSVEALRAGDAPVTLASVNRAKPIVDVMDASGLERLHVERTLSPELFRINDEGAYNGHVPVTAIVTLALCAAAVANGIDTVVLSNERSASVGNVEWDGTVVNHQWSKGFAAELAMAELLGTAAPGLRCFSLLRSLSELEISRRFARMERYHPVFTSCNRAFRIDETRRTDRWCGDCPKCRFVFLALAPWLSPGALAEIFGADLLDDPTQAEGFDALIGVGGHKPFECVGEIEESLAALCLVADRPEWKAHAIVQRFVETTRPRLELPADLLAAPFVANGTDAVPADVRGLLDATA